MDCPMKAAGGEGVILAYAGRSLGPDETVEFERHLEECAECRRIAAAQREVWSALDGWTAPPVSENFDARLFARIAEQERWNWRSRLVVSLREIGFRPMVPVAAACAAVMGVFLLRTPQIPSHPAPRRRKHRRSTRNRRWKSIRWNGGWTTWICYGSLAFWRRPRGDERSL